MKAKKVHDLVNSPQRWAGGAYGFRRLLERYLDVSLLLRDLKMNEGGSLVEELLQRRNKEVQEAWERIPASQYASGLDYIPNNRRFDSCDQCDTLTIFADGQDMNFGAFFNVPTREKIEEAFPLAIVRVIESGKQFSYCVREFNDSNTDSGEISVSLLEIEEEDFKTYLLGIEYSK